MAKFMFIYWGGDGGTTPPSPEEFQKVLAKWGAWVEKYMRTGQMIPGGDALNPGGRLVHPTGKVTDGPYPESKEIVGGYSLVDVKNYDEAVAIAKECPVLESGGFVEIRELAGLAGP